METLLARQGCRFEEQSLFPRPRTGIGTDIFDRMETLERQHREAAGMHASIGHLFEAWMASGALAPRDAVGLRPPIQRPLGLYTEHIRTEETLVFPHARRSLDAAAIAAIGPEFQLRRKWPSPGSALAKDVPVRPLRRRIKGKSERTIVFP